MIHKLNSLRYKVKRDICLDCLSCNISSSLRTSAVVCVGVVVSGRVDDDLGASSEHAGPKATRILMLG